MAKLESHGTVLIQQDIGKVMITKTLANGTKVKVLDLGSEIQVKFKERKSNTEHWRIVDKLNLAESFESAAERCIKLVTASRI